jgi:hypothetical protein
MLISYELLYIVDATNYQLLLYTSRWIFLIIFFFAELLIDDDEWEEIYTVLQFAYQIVLEMCCNKFF